MDTDSGSGISAEEREIRRALLAESIAELSGAQRPDRAASDVVRALDHYLSGGGPGAARASVQARARLERALGEVAEAGGPDAAAEAVGAVDDYLAETAPARQPREPAVADYGGMPGNEIRWARWIVIALAVMSSTVVAVTFSGGFLPGAIILAIWIAALFVVGTS